MNQETKSQEELDLDVKVMKQIAESAAEAAVRKVTAELRKEFKADMETLRREIVAAVREENRAYHGDLTPSQHAIQHDRINKFLEWMESMNKNFWGQIIAGLVKWVFVIFLIGYFMWNSAGEHIAKVSGQ